MLPPYQIKCIERQYQVSRDDPIIFLNNAESSKKNSKRSCKEKKFLFKIGNLNWICF